MSKLCRRLRGDWFPDTGSMKTASTPLIAVPRRAKLEALAAIELPILENNHMCKRTFLSLVVLVPLVATAWADHPLQFDVKFLTVDANEGCDIADFDGDGKLDIVAGRNGYRNGEWVPRPVRLIDDWSGYVRSSGGDPGSSEPPIMRYYVWNPQTKAFEGYTINEGEVGGGLQIRTADLDADGDIDIVVAGKDGTQILFNQRN